MEILDVAMVFKTVKLKALFNGLARHLVGVRGLSSSSHDIFVHSDVGGGDLIAL